MKFYELIKHKSKNIREKLKKKEIEAKVAK